MALESGSSSSESGSSSSSGSTSCSDTGSSSDTDSSSATPEETKPTTNSTSSKSQTQSQQQQQTNTGNAPRRKAPPPAASAAEDKPKANTNRKVANPPPHNRLSSDDDDDEEDSAPPAKKNARSLGSATVTGTAAASTVRRKLPAAVSKASNAVNKPSNPPQRAGTGNANNRARENGEGKRPSLSSSSNSTDDSMKIVKNGRKIPVKMASTVRPKQIRGNCRRPRKTEEEGLDQWSVVTEARDPRAAPTREMIPVRWAIRRAAIPAIPTVRSQQREEERLRVNI